MAGHVNGIAAASAVTGLVFIWSGIKGASVLTTMQSLVQGKQPAPDNAHPITVPAAGGSSATPSTTLAPGGSAAQNQAIAKMLAAPYGWSSGAEWDALVQLWDHESGWRNTAENPSSHAYGIPQALPYSKMPKAAWPPRAGGTADAGAQISWGLDYIRGRYGSPSKTWAAWQSRSPHWY